MAETSGVDSGIRPSGTQKVTQPTTTKRKPTDNTLTMDSFMKLLAAQLQNQDMMNPMKDNEFMQQMTQMATITAMNTMTDVAVTSYAASLVGKEVTLATITESNDMKEIVGTVTGSGLYGGKQVIFVNGESYYLSSVMAVGKLPPKKEEDEEGKEETKPAE